MMIYSFQNSLYKILGIILRGKLSKNNSQHKLVLCHQFSVFFFIFGLFCACLLVDGYEFDLGLLGRNHLQLLLLLPLFTQTCLSFATFNLDHMRHFTINLILRFWPVFSHHFILRRLRFKLLPDEFALLGG